MNSEPHSVIVSPLLKKFFPGFTEYKTGLSTQLLVKLVGEEIGISDSELGDLIVVKSTGDAVVILKRLADLYSHDDSVPSLKEIEEYEVTDSRSISASSVIIQHGRL